MDINELQKGFELNINQAISKKVIFDMNSERAKKRLAQMQKRKEYLNETDSIKNDKSTISLNETSIQIEESTPTQFSNKNNQNNSYNNKNINNILLNPFSFDETEKSENEISNIELNVSDLDCNIEIDENDNKLNELNNVSSSEYAKNFCTSTSKSFVHLNNNLVARAAAQNEKNTTSYLLALCPEILKKNNNNKDFIYENYAVNDAINEENEIETPNKGNHTFLNGSNYKKKYNFKKNFDINFHNKNHDFKKNNNVKDLKIDTFNKLLSNHVIHKKSKSGFSYNNILKNHSAENKKGILKNKFQNSGNKKNININKKILFDNFKSPLNKSKLSKIKPSNKINSTREFEYLKKNLIKNIPISHSKKPINPLSKRIKASNSNKSNSIILHHNKSKTSFTKPFFVKLNTSNTLRNNYSSSRVTENNQIKNQTNEIKKEYKNTYHKKNKTYGSKLPLDNNNNNKNNYFSNNHNYQNNNINENNSNHINNNLNHSYKKNLIKNKSLSKLEISNKNKIISSLKKINFFSNENYSKALLALNNSTCSLFTILVFYDNNTNKFSFRGLYEIISKDGNISANKIFSSSFCQTKININDINHFYTYDVKKEFVKFNFQNNENKKFNYNTILIF